MCICVYASAATSQGSVGGEGGAKMGRPQWVWGAAAYVQHANGANVPPEWETMSTRLLLKLCEQALKAKPGCGMGSSWPSKPSSLLEERVTILSFGKTRCRSDANCSLTQRLVSHPVSNKSTDPS